MGALYLKPLDDAMTRCGFMYARFMDDWVVIVPTRWKLRKLVRLVNEILAQLKVEKHPDKTFIGKAVRGLSFLGYFLKPGNLRVASTTISNMKECIARLYEQGACAARIGQYILRWVQWLLGGLSDCHILCDYLLCSWSPPHLIRCGGEGSKMANTLKLS